MRWVPVMPIIAPLLIACAASPVRSLLPTPGAPRESEGALIIFEVSGGIMGIREIWRFYGDGRVVLEGKRLRGTPSVPSVQARLPAEEIERAARHLIEAGFLELADEYMPADPCCGRFTYRLTLVYEGKTKTVTTMDGAEQPRALAEALRVVNELIKLTRSRI